MNAAAQRYLDQLDRETNELLDELTIYSETELNEPPRPEAWSAIQTMHHLLLSESLSLAYLRKKLSFDPELREAGLAEKAREWGLALFYRTGGWKRRAPAMIAGDKLPEHATLSKTASQWREARRDMRTYLAELPSELYSKSVFNHPIVGRITLPGMLYFHLLHFQHHRKQIRTAVATASD